MQVLHDNFNLFLRSTLCWEEELFYVTKCLMNGKKVNNLII
jgi:hypothetical protein